MLSKKDQEFYAALAARAEAEAYVPIVQLNASGVATSTTAEELDALIGELDDDADEPIASANWDPQQIVQRVVGRMRLCRLRRAARRSPARCLDRFG